MTYVEVFDCYVSDLFQSQAPVLQPKCLMASHDAIHSVDYWLDNIAIMFHEILHDVIIVSPWLIVQFYDNTELPASPIDLGFKPCQNLTKVNNSVSILWMPIRANYLNALLLIKAIVPFYLQSTTVEGRLDCLNQTYICVTYLSDVVVQQHLNKSCYLALWLYINTWLNTSQLLCIVSVLVQ